MDKELITSDKWQEGDCDAIWDKVEKLAVGHEDIREALSVPYKAAFGDYGDHEDLCWVAPDGEDVYVLPGTPEKVKKQIFG